MFQHSLIIEQEKQLHISFLISSKKNVVRARAPVKLFHCYAKDALWLGVEDIIRVQVLAMKAMRAAISPALFPIHPW